MIQTSLLTSHHLVLNVQGCDNLSKSLFTFAGFHKPSLYSETDDFLRGGVRARHFPKIPYIPTQLKPAERKTKERKKSCQRSHGGENIDKVLLIIQGLYFTFEKNSS